MQELSYPCKKGFLFCPVKIDLPEGFSFPYLFKIESFSLGVCFFCFTRSAQGAGIAFKKGGMREKVEYSTRRAGDPTLKGK